MDGVAAGQSTEYSSKASKDGGAKRMSEPTRESGTGSSSSKEPSEVRERSNSIEETEMRGEEPNSESNKTPLQKGTGHDERKENSFPLSNKFHAFDDSSFHGSKGHTSRVRNSSNQGSNFSPRSSIVSLHPSQNASDESVDKVMDNYKGFHATRFPGALNVPPLSHPIKPKFKKKKGVSLLGKLIYSSKKDHDHSHHHGHLLGNNDEESHIHAPWTHPLQKKRDTKEPSERVSSDTNKKKSVSSLSSSAKDKERIGSHGGEEKLDGNLGYVKAEDMAYSSALPPKEGIFAHKRPTKMTRAGTTFNLDMDLNEMLGIVKTPSGRTEDANKEIAPLPSDDKRKKSGPTFFIDEDEKRGSLTSSDRARSSTSVPGNENQHKLGSWKPPDSWDVKNESKLSKSGEVYDIDSDTDEADSEPEDDDTQAYSKLSPKSANDEQAFDSKQRALKKRSQVSIESLLKQMLILSEKRSKKNLPILYGMISTLPYETYDAKTPKGPNGIIRVFKEDNTFTTILCPLETTTAELLSLVQRKFFFETVNNFQISVYIGNSVKVLEAFEKPLKIQTGLLKLSGYLDEDNLRIIGREDLSFLCKFVVENIYLRSLTHEEETTVTKDYMYTNISGLDLKNIPIIFHQHTYEIEKLNVADNPSIYIPLDFIQSCTRLNTIIFSRNGCSKFPTNLLHAKNLTYLDLEKNFLDEIPSRISHLKNLTHLMLNSNQLTSLPKSFSKLVNLEHLNLSSNYFSEYPEVINKLSNLRDLDLSYNDLSLLPSSLGNLVRLVSLNLSTNKLSRTLPAFISNLAALVKLDIRYNQINNIDVLGSLPNLEVLLASKNCISTFNDRMERLRLLYFDRNPIINMEFEYVLPMLTVLDLSKAKLTALPGDFVSKISNLEKLVLDKNHLVNFPNEVSKLKKLVYLSVYGNNIQEIPPSIGELSSLQYLDLHSNSLSQIPDTIWKLNSLSFLNLSSNMLTSFPKPLMTSLNKFSSGDFKSNGRRSSSSLTPLVAASKRASFESLDQSFERVDYSKNGKNDKSEDESGRRKYSVPLITTSSGLSESLLVLSLADNRLSDDAFETISFLKEIKSLNLSYNDFLEVPDGALSRMSNITDLYLSGNQLASLPVDDLESLKTLKSLFLNNNKFVSLPAELSKLSNLQTFDVGSNQLKYNISNWPYDWNWHWNKSLRYLNFSGNKRFEIKETHVKNPETGEDFDSLLVLKSLKVLGLIDLTLTTPSVPDHSVDMRVRTTASELSGIGYGVSDTMGLRDHVSTRDVFLQKFRGNENEVLLCSFDGKNASPNKSHALSAFAKNTFVASFAKELNSLSKEDDVRDAIRRSFLTMNKEINSVFAAKKSNTFNPAAKRNADFIDLDLNTDSSSGCAVTMVYIKDKTLYAANIGDVEALLSRNNGDYVTLTTKHDPPVRSEFERIRASGGYLSGDGALDGVLSISRGAGFFNFLPHTHSGPDIKTIELTAIDDLIVIATKTLWDYITYELAIDILRQDKDDPMSAAQKLRDFAISYGATDKILVLVLTLGEKKKGRLGSTLYNNLGRETDFLAKKRRERSQKYAGDSRLRTLEEEIEPPEGTLALVFTDIKNSTLLWDVYPVAMRSAIKIHNRIMRRQLRIVGGYEVKTEGDAFMVSFPSPTAALLWCFTVQRQLLYQDWPSEILDTPQGCEVTDSKGEIVFRGLSVRMGIHWGLPVCERDLVTRRMDYFGPMVNRTARISAIADGGQIAASSDFLHEIQALFKLHDDVKNNKVTLEEAYQGNIEVGEIVEREIRSIEEGGIATFTLGERKLKGLEAPEMVTLLYPKKLESRFEFFLRSKNADNSMIISDRVVGSLPVDAVYGLRTISLRLERICSFLNGGYINEGFQKNSSGVLSRKTQKLFKESDLVGLLNHLVTRIENCIATLELRQQISMARGEEGAINFAKVERLSDLFNELLNLIQIVNQIKNDKLA